MEVVVVAQEEKKKGKVEKSRRVGEEEQKFRHVVLDRALGDLKLGMCRSGMQHHPALANSESVPGGIPQYASLPPPPAAAICPIDARATKAAHVQWWASSALTQSRIPIGRRASGKLQPVLCCPPPFFECVCNPHTHTHFTRLSVPRMNLFLSLHCSFSFQRSLHRPPLSHSPRHSHPSTRRPPCPPFLGTPRPPFWLSPHWYFFHIPLLR